MKKKFYKKSLLLLLASISLGACGKNNESLNDSLNDSLSAADSSNESSTIVENILNISVENRIIKAKIGDKVNLNLAQATSSLHGDLSSKVEVKVAIGLETILDFTNQTEVTNFEITSLSEYLVTYRIRDDEQEEVCAMAIQVEMDSDIQVDGNLNDEKYDIEYKTGIDKNVTVKAYANMSGIYFGVQVLDSNIAIKSPSVNMGNFDSGDCFDIYLNPTNGTSTNDLYRIRMNLYNSPEGLIYAFPNEAGSFKADMNKYGIKPDMQRVALIGNSTISIDGGNEKVNSDIDEGFVAEFFFNWTKFNVTSKPESMGIGFRQFDNDYTMANKREFNPWTGTNTNTIGSTLKEYGALTFEGENKGISWNLNESTEALPPSISEVDGYVVDKESSKDMTMNDSLAIIDQNVEGNFSLSYKIWNSAIVGGLKNDGTDRGINFVIEREDNLYDIIRVDLKNASKPQMHIINVFYSYKEGVSDLESVDFSTFETSDVACKLPSATDPSIGSITITRTINEDGAVYQVNAGQPNNEPQDKIFTFTSTFSGNVKIGFALDHLGVSGTVLNYTNFTF